MASFLNLSNIFRRRQQQTSAPVPVVSSQPMSPTSVTSPTSGVSPMPASSPQTSSPASPASAQEQEARRFTSSTSPPTSPASPNTNTNSGSDPQQRQSSNSYSLANIIQNTNSENNTDNNASHQPRSSTSPEAPESPALSSEYDFISRPSSAERPRSSSAHTGQGRPKHIRAASRSSDWYPSWLPRRPPPPVPPASTVASERGHGEGDEQDQAGVSEYERVSSELGQGRGFMGRGARATGPLPMHRTTPSYDTARTGYTAYSGVTSAGATTEEFVDIGGNEDDNGDEGENEEGEGLGTEKEGGLGIGRRQTPRSVRIVSAVKSVKPSMTSRQTSSGAARGQHARKSSKGSNTSTGAIPVVRSRKEGHVHGMRAGPVPWWRQQQIQQQQVQGQGLPRRSTDTPSVAGGGGANMQGSIPLSSTLAGSAIWAGGERAASALPPHMREYVPTPGPSTSAAGAGMSTAGYGHTRGMSLEPMLGYGGGGGTVKPRFNVPALDLDFLISPSGWTMVQYRLWPLWVFGPVVVQTFLDLNTIYCLVQIALHPTPASPPTAAMVRGGGGSSLNPTSSRNWVLASAAYGICWLVWIFGVIIMYEIVYSWWRRWRCRRPLIVPLYLSSSAHNLVCMTSFAHFCFFRYIRNSARPPLPLPRLLRSWCASSAASSMTAGTATIPSRVPTPSIFSSVAGRDSFQRDITSPISVTAGEGKERMDPQQGTSGNNNHSNVMTPFPMIPYSTTARAPFLLSSLSSWADYLAETAYFYIQNIPTISLLLPRAALALSLLLAFWNAPLEDIALAALGGMARDQTFFNSEGGLSGYAKVVLTLNVAWAGARTLFVFMSILMLWWISGMGCAGICGPRFRWEEPGEDEFGKFGYGGVEEKEEYGVRSTWTWMECTRARIYDAYDLCLFSPIPVKEKPTLPPLSGTGMGREASQGTATTDDGDKENILPLPRELPASGSAFAGNRKERRRVLSEEEEDELVNRALKSVGIGLTSPPQVHSRIPSSSVIPSNSKSNVSNAPQKIGGVPPIPTAKRERGALSEELFDTPPELRRELDLDYEFEKGLDIERDLDIAQGMARDSPMEPARQSSSSAVIPITSTPPRSKPGSDKAGRAKSHSISSSTKERPDTGSGQSNKSGSPSGSKTKRKKKRKEVGYVFSGYPAQLSSSPASPVGGVKEEEKIPFPPSPSTAGGDFEETQREGLRRMREESAGAGGVTSAPEEEEEEYDEFGVNVGGVDIEAPSSTSGTGTGTSASNMTGSRSGSGTGSGSLSMSSLGHPIASSYQSRRSRGSSSAGTRGPKTSEGSAISGLSGLSGIGAGRGGADSRTSSSVVYYPPHTYGSPIGSPVSPRSPGSPRTASSSYGSPVSNPRFGGAGFASTALEEPGDEDTTMEYDYSGVSGESPLVRIPMPPTAAAVRAGRERRRERRERLGSESDPSVQEALADVVLRDRARTLSGGESAPYPYPAYEPETDEEDDVRGDEGDMTRTTDFTILETTNTTGLGLAGDEEEEEEEEEEREKEDSVGLLSGGVSPRSSLGGMRSRSASRSRANSGSSVHGRSRSRSNSLLGAELGFNINLGALGRRSRQSSASVSARSRQSSAGEGMQSMHSLHSGHSILSGHSVHSGQSGYGASVSNGSRASRAVSFSSGNDSFSSGNGARAHNRSLNGGDGSGSGSIDEGARSRASSSGRSVSFQTQAGVRSRAQSLIQNMGIGSAISVGSGMGRRDYWELGVRSRASSLARLEEVPSLHRRSGSGATHESSSASIGDGEVMESPVSGPGEGREEDTFGQPIGISTTRIRVDSTRSARSTNGNGSHQQVKSPLSAEVKQEQDIEQAHSRESDVVPNSELQMHEDEDAVLPSSTSNSGSVEPTFVLTSPPEAGPSTLPIPVPFGGARPQASFVSSAHDSMVTRPTVDEHGTTSSGSIAGRRDGEDGQTPSSYGTVHMMNTGGLFAAGTGGQGGMGPA